MTTIDVCKEPNPKYIEKWQEYRLLRKRSRIFQFLSIVIVLAFSYGSHLLNADFLKFISIVSLAIFLKCAYIFESKHNEILCPRCDKPYFQSDTIDLSLFNFPIKECEHCGLPKWSNCDPDEKT